MRQQYGLVEGHAYGVLRSRTVPNNEGTETRLVQVRNPWGSAMEWKGAWGDADTANWTDEAIAICEFSPEPDGTFWLSVEDFSKCFSEFCVTYIRDGWSQSSVALTNGAAGRGAAARAAAGGDASGRCIDGGDLVSEATAAWVVSFSIDEATTIDVGLHQTDDRCFHKDAKHLYRGLTLFVTMADGTEVLNAPVGVADRQVWRELQLEPGEYLAYCFATNGTTARGSAHNTVDFTLSVYSEKPIGGGGLQLVPADAAPAAGVVFDAVGELVSSWRPGAGYDASGVGGFADGSRGTCEWKELMKGSELRWIKWNHGGLHVWIFDNSKAENTEFTTTLTINSDNMVFLCPSNFRSDTPQVCACVRVCVCVRVFAYVCVWVRARSLHLHRRLTRRLAHHMAPPYGHYHPT
jgi:hypothetical protein